MEFDILAERQKVCSELENSDEIDLLTSTIDVYDLHSIATFGEKSAEQISEASDAVLRSINTARDSKSGELMDALAEIMSKFSISEINGNRGVFGKLFGSTQKQADRIYEKYKAIGEETDRIFVRLKQYEDEVGRSSRNLVRLFEANLGYYRELVKYVSAGEQGCREISEYLEQRQEDFRRTGDKAILPEIGDLKQALAMLEQRTADLKTAESVAVQAVPMIKAMEYSNRCLLDKINTAFMVTLPVFRQSLSQAISLKKQGLEAQAMEALHRKTNEYILENARDDVHREMLEERLGSAGTLKTDRLEEIRKAIVSGIDEFRNLQKKSDLQCIDFETTLVRVRARLDGINKN